MHVPPRKKPQSQRTQPITHVQAQGAALRFIHSHFGQKPHAIIRIPAQPDDDDILLMDYIEQQVLLDTNVTPSLAQQLAVAACAVVTAQATKPGVLRVSIEDFRKEFEKVLNLDHYTGEQAEAILPKEY